MIQKCIFKCNEDVFFLSMNEYLYVCTAVSYIRTFEFKCNDMKVPSSATVNNSLTPSFKVISACLFAKKIFHVSIYIANR